jgi:cardiolipin synthase A/B
MTTILPLPEIISLHGLIVMIGLLIYVLTTHSLQQRRAPAAAISWVLVIALIPYVGLPLYLLFGTRKLAYSGNRTREIAPIIDLQSDDAWPRQMAASMGQPPVASYERLHIHIDGRQALQSLWKLIDSAKHELVLCAFLLGRDDMGKALMARLMDKSREGVRIRLLIDGAGRLMGGGINLNKLKSAGVQVALFGPILHVPFKSRVNLRYHRKMVVSDGIRLWCGGRNFAAEYFDGLRKGVSWKDLSFDLQGPLAGQACELFERDWAFVNGSSWIRTAREEQTAREPFAQVIASGPDQADDTVHDLLVTACFKALSSIAAVTPYFVPSDALLVALLLAARRGVVVNLILPARSNHRMADFARHRALRALAAAGGRVWLTPYMLHAKAVVIDDILALSGSANFDSRSLFLNYELMVAFYAGSDIRRFAGVIEEHREAAARYLSRKPGLLRDLTEGLLLWLGFQL